MITTLEHRYPYINRKVASLVVNNGPLPISKIRELNYLFMNVPDSLFLAYVVSNMFRLDFNPQVSAYLLKHLTQEPTDLIMRQIDPAKLYPDIQRNNFIRTGIHLASSANPDKKYAFMQWLASTNTSINRQEADSWLDLFTHLSPEKAYIPHDFQEKAQLLVLHFFDTNPIASCNIIKRIPKNISGVYIQRVMRDEKVSNACVSSINKFIYQLPRNIKKLELIDIFKRFSHGLEGLNKLIPQLPQTEMYANHVCEWYLRLELLFNELSKQTKSDEAKVYTIQNLRRNLYPYLWLQDINGRFRNTFFEPHSVNIDLYTQLIHEINKLNHKERDPWFDDHDLGFGKFSQIMTTRRSLFYR